MERFSSFCLDTIRHPPPCLSDPGMDFYCISRPKSQHQRDSDHTKTDSDNQYLGEHFRFSHSSNQSINRVTPRQKPITGAGDNAISAAFFCAVRADQANPPTSTRLCRGARMNVNTGCQAVCAVPNMFHPQPSGSDSVIKM